MADVDVFAYTDLVLVFSKGILTCSELSSESECNQTEYHKNKTENPQDGDWSCNALSGLVSLEAEH